MEPHPLEDISQDIVFNPIALNWYLAKSLIFDELKHS